MGASACLRHSRVAAVDKSLRLKHICKMLKMHKNSSAGAPILLNQRAKKCYLLTDQRCKSRDRTCLYFDVFIPGPGGDADDARSARDLLDGAHEDLRDDGDAEEAPEHSDEVEDDATLGRPRKLADKRQEKPLVGTGVVAEAHGTRGVHHRQSSSLARTCIEAGRRKR